MPPDAPAIPAPVEVLGVPVLPFASYAHAADWVADRIADRRRTFCVAINPEKIYRALREPRLLDVLTAADAGLCDGIGVALAAKLLHGRTIPRCTGCDLFSHLIAAAERRGWGVYLLGASPESNATACERLQARHPGLRVVGRRDGFFDDVPAVLAAVNAARPDMLFVAMGSPRQEYFLTQHADAIDAPFRMGVGGTLDVISGTARRAPRVFQRTGTEFLFRLLSDPGRWQRHLALPGFVLDVLTDRTHPRGTRRTRSRTTGSPLNLGHRHVRL